MKIFTIWAPYAKSVRVVVRGEHYPMDHGADDYWRTAVEGASHGIDYGFLFDDDPKIYPDPRSPWQPNGVHEVSRVVDHGRFSWSSPVDWNAPPLANAVIYELHIGTFTPAGTFDAAIRRLSYLKDLGITHVELMPVASFAGRWGWGYDGVALFAPFEPYGGPDGLKRFVDACHAHGLATVLDVVYNHFGPVGNYAGTFGPYVLHDYETPWGGNVNLDKEGSREVRRFFCDNALMWLRDYRFDALRLDAVHAFRDLSSVHFLQQLSGEVAILSEQLGRNLRLIAESDLNDTAVVTPINKGGLGMDAQWDDDFHHAVHSALTGERQGYYQDYGTIKQIADALCSVFIAAPRNPDYFPSAQRQTIGQLKGDQFVAYIQNHDQSGNRAKGERLHHLVGTNASRLAAGLLLTGPFVPMIFQGEEFASSSPFLYFADHDDPAMREAVSAGRRREFAAFGWGDDIPDPEDPVTFTASKLNWEEESHSPNCFMLDWYTRLLALRREHPSLTSGDINTVGVAFDEEARWLVMTRTSIQVVCNFDTDTKSIPVHPEGRLLLVSAEGASIQGDSISLPGHSVAIMEHQ